MSGAPIKVAVNGFGRIGELIFRRSLDDELATALEVVAINDIVNMEQIAYLLRFDSVHKNPQAEFECGPGWLRVDGREIRVFQERDPADLPWGELGIDVAVDATGVFTDREGLGKHLHAGAKRALLTAPAKGDGADVTICIGVNHDSYQADEHKLVSNASCTTNCLAPVARCIDEAFGLRWGVMSTIHAYTGSQALVDQAHKKLRRGRAAAINIVPTTTGAAEAIGEVLPRLSGRFAGMAFRVPVPAGSVIDLTVETERPLDIASLHQAFKAASEDPSYRGVLSITEDELVSSDIVGSNYSAVVDAGSTLVVGDNVAKIVAWYDNEWGYACRVVDTLALMAERR